VLRFAYNFLHAEVQLAAMPRDKSVTSGYGICCTGAERRIADLPEQSPTTGAPGSRLGVSPQPGGAGPRPNHAILLPEADLDDDADDLITPPVAAQPRITPRPIPKRTRYATLSRRAALFASGVAGAVLVIGAYVALASRDESAGRSAAEAAPRGVPAAHVAMLDRRADTLSLALEAFSLRVRMYESRRMACDGLSRGLQQVEDAWLAYSLARRQTLGTSDSTRENRDGALYADVRAVEQRFERSSCTRP